MDEKMRDEAEGIVRRLRASYGRNDKILTDALQKQGMPVAWLVAWDRNLARLEKILKE